MKTPTSSRSRAPVDHSNRCPEAELAEGAITAITRLAAAEENKAASYAAIAAAIERVVPAAEVIHGFGDRLDALCTFIRRRGPWLLASIPVILSAVGAITPNAAAALKTLLAGLGAG